MADNQNDPLWIGEYEVAAFLGNGSFADAYKARSGDRTLVVKWLRLDAPSGGKPRFQNEAWALERLKHESVPKFVAQGEFEGRPFIAMSLAEGRSLRRRLEEPIGERGTFGESWVLRVVRTLLTVICHMQDVGITHRDIKDANVVCDDHAKKITLLDFGFCKAIAQPADADSFYQVGAPRYSPPNKLRYPSVTHPSHDVFAVGVLAYLLLTNGYPWSVPPDQDHGLLAALMERSVPPRVTDLNSAVSYETAQFVAGLINAQDDRRPDAKEALQQAGRLLETGTKGDLKYPSHYTGYLPKVTRDPIHGDIRLTKFESDLIDCPQFQRLRYIKQLGFTNLIYSGAQHTRFSHSIGTMHVADRIIQSVAETSGVRVDPEERLLVRTYALLHDLTHIPFGHTIEDELGFFPRHDHNPDRMKRLLDDSLARLLDSTSYGQVVLREVTAQAPRPTLSLAKDIVGGHAGADVLDYVDRDSTFCGVDHSIDTAIYRHYRAMPIHGPIESPAQHLVSKFYGSRGVRLDASFAVESLFLQRYALFLKVYTHTMKIVAGSMLGKALQHVIDGVGLDKLETIIEAMGDDELLLWLITQKYSIHARSLSKEIMARKLYKPVFIGEPLPPNDHSIDSYRLAQERMSELKLDTAEGRKNAEIGIAEAAGVGGESVIIYWPKEAPGLQKVRHYVQERPGDSPSLITSAANRRMIERHVGLWKAYVFSHPDISDDRKAVIGASASTYVGMTNKLSRN